MLLNCFICLHTVSRARKWHLLSCQRWQCQEIWKQACLGRAKPFHWRRLLFDRPEHLPAGSLPPELCWDMLLHHTSSFQSQTLGILPQTSYMLHFLALTISRTCKGSSQKTSEGEPPPPQDLRHRPGPMPSETLLLRLGTGWHTGVPLKAPKSWCPCGQGMEQLWCVHQHPAVLASTCHTSQEGFTQHNSLSNTSL